VYQIDGYWKVQLACLLVLVALFVVMHFGVFVDSNEMSCTNSIAAEATI